MSFFKKLKSAPNMKYINSGVGVLALVLFSGFTIYEAAKKEVTIVNDGEEQVVYTHKHTVGELIDQVGITVGAHDELSHEEDAPIEDGMTIDYKKAKQIIVTIDGKSEAYYTTEDTVSAFLQEQALSFSEHDDMSHAMDDPIEEGLKLNVNTAFDVVINDGGDEHILKTTGATVEELLNELDIELNKKDKITHELNDRVTKETEIEIIRVTAEKVELTEMIDFKTEIKEDSTLLKGEERVITEGEQGKKVKTYKVTKENGEEVERELIEEEVAKEPVNKVIAVGTKEPVQNTNSSNLVTLSATSSDKPSGGTTLTVTASAFTATCGGCSGVTSTGIDLKSNPNQKVIAVDPSIIPLGSKVWVEGYGTAIAGDTGGAIRGNRIDVHVPNNQAAYQWGVRTVKIKILD